MGFCVCSMFCCKLLCYLSSFAIILKGLRLVALLCLSSCYLVALLHGAMSWSAVWDCGTLYFLIILTFFILINSFKIQHTSGIWVITQFLGHRIQVMWTIDQHSMLVVAGHVVIGSSTYSSQLRN